MLRLLSKRVVHPFRRNFSKYMEDNYGKNVHRLANRPEVEVSAFEIFTATFGTVLLIGDVRTKFFNSSRFSASHNEMTLLNQFRIYVSLFKSI